ncbi:hypothetical protein BGZ72_004236 [Mortierella alpina]|nr:hypothetical protein BGZ72_004236 [Mortierella alpina]
MSSQSNSPPVSASTEERYSDATKFVDPTSHNTLATPSPASQQTTGQAEISSELSGEESKVKEEEEGEEGEGEEKKKEEEREEEDEEEDEEEGDEEEEEEEEEEDEEAEEDEDDDDSQEDSEDDSEEEDEDEEEVEEEGEDEDDELEEDAPVATRRSARLGAKVAKSSDNHPSYHAMIVTAIKSHKGALGVTRNFIKTYIHKQFKIDYNSIEASFNDAVKSGRKRSIFTFTNSNNTRLALIKKPRAVKVSNSAKPLLVRSVPKTQSARATIPKTAARKGRSTPVVKPSAKKQSASKSTSSSSARAQAKTKAGSKTASKTATPIKRGREQSSKKRKSDAVDEPEQEEEAATTSRVLISRATQTSTRPASNRPFPKKIRKTTVKKN